MKAGALAEPQRTAGAGGGGSARGARSAECETLNCFAGARLGSRFDRLDFAFPHGSTSGRSCCLLANLRVSQARQGDPSQAPATEAGQADDAVAFGARAQQGLEPGFLAIALSLVIVG